MPRDFSGKWQRQRLVTSGPWWKRAKLQAIGTLVSLSVSGIALVVSIRGLRTSQNALIIGQRAYLSITNGKLTVQQVGDIDLDDEVLITCAFTIRNSGNTPANAAVPQVDWIMNPRWRPTTTHFFGAPLVKPQIGKPEVEHPHHLLIGPKSDIRYTITTRWWHPKRKYDHKLSREDNINQTVDEADTLYQPVMVVGKLAYTDVFSVSHPLQWCWVSHLGWDYPRDCTDEEKRTKQASDF